MQLSASKPSKSTVGIPTSPTRSRTCKATKLISAPAVRWCSTHWSRSRMRWIQRSLSVDRVARVSAARAQWTLAAPTHSLASARLMGLIWTSLWRSILCHICMWWRISCLTWITSTSNIDRFSHGFSESELRWSLNYLQINQNFSHFLTIAATSPQRRREKRSTCSQSTIVLNSMDSTNAFCVLAARHRVHLTGGMATSISAQLCSCRHIAGSSIHVMSRPRLVSTTWEIHSVCIVVIQSWIAHVHARKGWIQDVQLLRSRNFSVESLIRDNQAWRQQHCTSRTNFLHKWIFAIFVRLPLLPYMRHRTGSSANTIIRTLIN